jgi:hypothetical protein
VPLTQWVDDAPDDYLDYWAEDYAAEFLDVPARGPLRDDEEEDDE